MVAIDDATGRYAVAHAAAYVALKEKGGVVPINYKNERILDAFANLAIHEELTWSHADKMSLVEYPTLSASQAKLRRRRECSISEVETGKDDETIGRQRDKITGRKNRIYDYMTPERDKALIPAEYLDLYTALEGAGLTERQHEAIALVYFDGMTQEDAATRMGLNKANVNVHLKRATTRLRKFMDDARAKV